MVNAREMAWRVFAGEYNVSDLEQRGEGDRAPSYVVTPLGAKINRLFVVGVITDLENRGTETEPLWRGRISDPTGVFYVSAGQYQPKAAAALAKLKIPSFVAVIGKSRLYRPDEGGAYLSIKPETVKPADENLRGYWVLEACKSLQTRLDAMEEALKMEAPSKEELRALGYSDDIAGGLMLALPHYREGLDIERYRSMLKDALRFITPEKRFANASRETGEEGDDAGENDEEEKVAAEIKNDEGDGEKGAEDKEEKVLKVIGGLDNSSKGVAYEAIIDGAKKDGIGVEELEELFNGLLEKGLVYEPMLGRVKLVKGK